MLRKLFVAGLVILLPFAVTYTVIKFAVNLITKPFDSFVYEMLSDIGFTTGHFLTFTPDQLTHLLSKALIVIAITTLLFIIGFVSHWFAKRAIIYFTDQVVGKLPFVGKIYGACKDFTHALFSPKSNSFSQVVLAPYPSKDHLSIGLVSSEFENILIPSPEKEFVSVLIPGTPNPTIGFVLLYAKKDLIYLDMDTADAMRFIISCGTSNLAHGFKRLTKQS